MEIKYKPTLGEAEAIRIIQAEKQAWEDGNVFITDKVQFIMRNVVRKARKNYWGVFTEPKDPVTGREKIFIPMTETSVETTTKNIDIDSKDIETKATHPSSYSSASIFRYILKKKLEDIDFGKTLNKLIRSTSIDGTGFLKAEKEDGKLCVTRPDRLNMIYDQSAETLDQSSAIIERSVLMKPEFDEYKWDNMEYVKGVTTIDMVDSQIKSSTRTSEIPYVEVYSRYGYLPKFCITDKESDINTYLYCKLIVSGIGHSPVVHSIEEVEDHPYQEVKLREVPNRLDGKGIPEMLFNIQSYVNEVVNMRLNKGRIVHLGLFEIKGNVTPQAFKRLFATGAIKTDQASSITPIITGSIDPSSYKDEEQANLWATRVTGANNDEQQYANQPATNKMIDQQSAGKGYGLKIEDMFLSISKFIKEKVVPIIKAALTEEEIVRITGDPKALLEIDDMLARNYVYNKIEEMDPSDRMGMTEDIMEQMVQAEIKALKKQGKDRFPQIAKKAFDTEYDISISMGDNNINGAISSQIMERLIAILAPLGKDVDPLIREIADDLGKDGDSIIQEINKNPQQAPSQGQAPQDQMATTMPGEMMPQMQ